MQRYRCTDDSFGALFLVLLLFFRGQLRQATPKNATCCPCLPFQWYTKQYDAFSLVKRKEQKSHMHGSTTTHVLASSVILFHLLYSRESQTRQLETLFYRLCLEVAFTVRFLYRIHVTESLSRECNPPCKTCFSGFAWVRTFHIPKDRVTAASSCLWQSAIFPREAFGPLVTNSTGAAGTRCHTRCFFFLQTGILHRIIRLIIFIRTYPSVNRLICSSRRRKHANIPDFFWRY